MLQLKDESLIGSGLHRDCYEHPTDQHVCVKIVANGDLEETRREQNYYEYLAHRNISWEMLPKFFGNTPTNKGEGALFELIRDYNGQPSSSLGKFIDDETITETHFEGLCTGLSKLKTYLLQNHIITMTLKSKNILYKRTSEVEGLMIIIDNIGNSDFIPICNYSHYFAEKKILRKWTEFENKLLRKHPNNNFLKEILVKSN